MEQKQEQNSNQCGLDDDYLEKKQTIIITNYIPSEDGTIPDYGISAEVPALLARQLACFFETLDEVDKASNTNIILCYSSRNPRIFNYLIEYINMHVNNEPITEIEKPIKSLDLALVLGFNQADDQRKIFIRQLTDFINNIHFMDLFSLLNLANYLHMQSLLDIISAKIAIYLKNKSQEEIKTLFENSREDHRLKYPNDIEYKVCQSAEPMDVDSGPEQKQED